MNRALVLGYGNPDRQDDGAAWWVLLALHAQLGRGPAPDFDAGLFPSGEAIDLYFGLQLTPEMADTIAEYGRVCFVDAHTGAVPAEVNFQPVESQFQASPFTHHMTPATCLALAEMLAGRQPEAVLVSVRGYQFGFARQLSERTGQLVAEAAELVWQWLNSPITNTEIPAASG